DDGVGLTGGLSTEGFGTPALEPPGPRSISVSRMPLCVPGLDVSVLAVLLSAGFAIGLSVSPGDDRLAPRAASVEGLAASPLVRASGTVGLSELVRGASLLCVG